MRHEIRITPLITSVIKKKANGNLRQFAQSINIPYGTLYSITYGNLKTISPHNLQKILPNYPYPQQKVNSDFFYKMANLWIYLNNMSNTEFINKFKLKKHFFVVKKKYIPKLLENALWQHFKKQNITKDEIVEWDKELTGQDNRIPYEKYKNIFEELSNILPIPKTYFLGHRISEYENGKTKTVSENKFNHAQRILQDIKDLTYLKQLEYVKKNFNTTIRIPYIDFKKKITKLTELGVSFKEELDIYLSDYTRGSKKNFSLEQTIHIEKLYQNFKKTTNELHQRNINKLLSTLSAIETKKTESEEKRGIEWDPYVARKEITIPYENAKTTYKELFKMAPILKKYFTNSDSSGDIPFEQYNKAIKILNDLKLLKGTKRQEYLEEIIN